MSLKTTNSDFAQVGRLSRRECQHSGFDDRRDGGVLKAFNGLAKGLFSGLAVIAENLFLNCFNFNPQFYA